MLIFYGQKTLYIEYLDKVLFIVVLLGANNL